MENEELYLDREIIESVNLCDGKGKIQNDSIGWSRNPVFNCNIKGSWLRKKKWNHWRITNNECFLSISISNNDYIGTAFVYFLDFKTQNVFKKTIISPFGKGHSMPEKVKETLTFRHSKMSLYLIEEENGTHIVAKCIDFMGDLMEVNFKVTYPDNHESLNVLVPLYKNTFKFTSKYECLPVDGELTIGEKVYSFSPSNTFACLDFGRGILPYNNKWKKVSASGMVNGKAIGINLGVSWSKRSKVTDNYVVVDGIITKVSEDIIFQHDNDDYMKQWEIKTVITSKINLKFTPFYEKVTKSNIIILKLKLHQIIGSFSGEIQNDAGEHIIIDAIKGAIQVATGKL